MPASFIALEIAHVARERVDSVEPRRYVVSPTPQIEYFPRKYLLDVTSCSLTLDKVMRFLPLAWLFMKL